MKRFLPIFAVAATFACLVPLVTAETISERGNVGDSVKKFIDKDAGARAMRLAPPRHYKFAKAKLNDVFRLLGKEAHINVVSFPEHAPEASRLITLTLCSSPFQALETLCKANGLSLIRDMNEWHIRPSNDDETVGRAYKIRGVKVQREDLEKDVRAILDVRENDATQAQAAVRWKEESGEIYIVGTRLQHTWVRGYLMGAGMRPQ